MKLFSSWFGKKKQKEQPEKSAEVSDTDNLQTEETSEADSGADTAGSGDAEEAGPAEENADAVCSETAEEDVPDTEPDSPAEEINAADEPAETAAAEADRPSGAPEETPATEESAETAEAADAAADDSGSQDGASEDVSAKAEGKSRFSGLRSMWEATRRLALTPVDPWFAKMARGLNKTRQSLVGQVKNLFSSRSAIDEDLWQDLEDVLLTADVGVGATDRILEELRQVVKEKKIKDPQLLTGELKAILGRILKAEAVEDGAEEIVVPNRGLKVEHGKLMVVLMVGVNGAGKTTTTAKIAAHYKNQGFKVLMAAADTFRAAAIDQLQVWADRIGVDLIRHREGSDPAAVVYDAVAAAKSRGTELLLVDTAGRLHNKANLMEELRKSRRVAGRDLEGAPHEILLVLDATTGQNALEQARVFNQVTELTGLILCKLDGTSRGGIILAVAQELNIPVRYIGVGEGVDDLREFEPEQFLAALFND